MSGHDMVFLLIDAFGGSKAIGKWLDTWFPDAFILNANSAF